MTKDAYAYECIEKTFALAFRQQRMQPCKDLVSRLVSYFGEESKEALFKLEIDGRNYVVSLKAGHLTGRQPIYQITLRGEDNKREWILGLHKKIEEDSPMNWNLVIPSQTKHNTNLSESIYLKGDEKLYDVMSRVQAIGVLNAVIRFMDPEQQVQMTPPTLVSYVPTLMDALRDRKLHDNIENHENPAKKTIKGSFQPQELGLEHIIVNWRHIVTPDVEQRMSTIMVNKKDGELVWSLRIRPNTAEPFRVEMCLYKNGTEVAVPEEEFEKVFFNLKGMDVLRAMENQLDIGQEKQQTAFEDAMAHASNQMNP